jgi:hypothetical protein
MDIIYKIVGIVQILFALLLINAGFSIYMTVQPDYDFYYGQYIKGESINLDKLVDNMKKNNLNCPNLDLNDYNLSNEMEYCYWKDRVGIANPIFSFFLISFCGLIPFGYLLVTEKYN